MKNITKTITLSVFALAVVLSFQLIPDNAFACVSSSDCSNPYFYGGQYCQGNSLYQTQVQYSCISSRCVATQNQYLIQTCSGTNNTCVQGLWFTGCKNGSTGSTTGTTGTTTVTPSQCYSHSYQKCVENNVYWFDSCNIQQGLSKVCSANQICQAGDCYINTVSNINNTTTNTTINTTYINHFSKGCINNIVYWYDTLGNKNDAYQNCSYSSQLCQDGKCVTDPTPKPAVSPQPSSNTTTVPAPAKTASTVSCDPGKVLAQACVPIETFNSDISSTNTSDKQNSANTSDTTQVSEQPNVTTPEQNSATAAVSQSKTNPIMEFLNKWYVWIIIGIIMTIFFIIVFRKSSSKVEGRIQKQ